MCHLVIGGYPFWQCSSDATVPRLVIWFVWTMFAARKARDFAPIGLAVVPFLAHPRAPANLTTKQKIKEFLRTRNVHAQRLSLQQFLTCLGLECYLDVMRGRVLEDLATLSFEDMAELGIQLDHRVQLKNGINYLMDLHNKTFVFAPVPNAA